MEWREELKIRDKAKQLEGLVQVKMIMSNDGANLIMDHDDVDDDDDDDVDVDDQSLNTGHARVQGA